MAALSKEEIALYDRQIRLWGLEAQKKIRECRVYFVCQKIDGFVQECCKNLALSGVAMIKIFAKEAASQDFPDDLMYMPADFDSELSAMNSRLETVVEDGLDGCLEAVNNDLFDFLLISGKFDVKLVASLNESCRGRQIPFSYVFGFVNNYYAIFNDFSEYFYFDNQSNKVEVSFPSLTQVLQNKKIEGRDRELLTKVFATLTNTGVVASNDCPQNVAANAIIGALASQEILKIFSRKECPIKNLFILDSQNLKNSVNFLQ